MKIYKTKRLTNNHIKRLSDFFNIKLLKKQLHQKNKHKNMIFPNNIYLPKIIKNNYDFSLRNINESRNKSALKKSKSFEQNNNVFHQINFPSIKEIKKIKKNNNNNNNKNFNNNNSNNPIIKNKYNTNKIY
jgi:hypothetical protein